MIIDCHIHHYPEIVRAQPTNWAKANGEAHWAHLVDSKLQGWSSTEKLLSDMQTAGIDKAILLGWYWEHHETCVWYNQQATEWLKQHPDRFLAFASVQPLAGNKALDDLKKAHEQGISGIGEVFPKVQGFDFEHPTWLKIVEWAIENNLPINMHVTEPVGHLYRGKVKNSLADIQRLVERYPELTLILAHWGGLLPFYELNLACRKAFKNVYYDISASPLLYDKRIYRAVIDIIGPERILYGSDYPLKLYKQSEPEFNTFIEEILASGLSKEESAAILYENSKNLFGL